jgi:hypothetical protein
MLDSYNRDDMDIEIIQTSLDIVMTKYKQSKQVYSSDGVCLKYLISLFKSFHTYNGSTTIAMLSM